MSRRTRPTDPKRVVAYCRTSTTDQRNGIDAQHDSIDRYAKAHGLTVASWHEDRGVSGAKPALERPGLAAAIDALAQHGAGVLLVAKRDRLARDTTEAGLATRLIERLGAKVIDATGSGNGDGPEDAMHRGILDVFAMYERAIIRARTRAALRSRRDRNLKFTKWPPYGFRWTRDRRMVEDPAQQATLARMRTLRRRGLSFRRIGERLTKEGHRPARAKAWAAGVVRTLCLRVTPAPVKGGTA